MPASPTAAHALIDLIADGDNEPADDAMGATDCPEGCTVEPDGTCPHDYLSAAMTAGVI